MSEIIATAPDRFLRAWGFEIAGRPKGQTPMWRDRWRKGRVVTEAKAIEIAETRKANAEASK